MCSKARFIDNVQSPDTGLGRKVLVRRITEVEIPGTPRSWQHDCPLMHEIEFQPVAQTVLEEGLLKLDLASARSSPKKSRMTFSGSSTKCTLLGQMSSEHN